MADDNDNNKEKKVTGNSGNGGNGGGAEGGNGGDGGDGYTRNQWDGGPWPQEANSAATDEDNHRMLEATANRPADLTQTPDAQWNDLLARQQAQDAEDVKLQRFAQNRAVIDQMIKARDDRVIAQKQAIQAREDEFSALASLCYDPNYGQAFVDTSTLQAYNAAHQGEQGFNPITKMGRMSGGALFVERQMVDEKGRPIVEEFIDKKTGQPVRRPKIAIEAIGPQQFQARMKDFVGWEWDGVTKQFMTQSDFAKVQKAREDKAREEMYQKQLDADPRLRMADTKMRADLAAQQAQQEGGKGSGSRGTSSSRGSGAGTGNVKPPTFDENEKRFNWMKSQLEDMSRDLFDKNGNPTDPDRMKKYEQYKASFERFRDKMFGVGDDESAPGEGEVEMPGAAPGTGAKPNSLPISTPFDEEPEPKIDTRRYRVEALRSLRAKKDGPTYTFTDSNGEEHTVSFAEAEKMAAEGNDPEVREWLKLQINLETGSMIDQLHMQRDKRKAERKQKREAAADVLYPQGAAERRRREISMNP